MKYKERSAKDGSKRLRCRFMLTWHMVISMGRKVTMQDIADQLGVTKVSVSKAINNQPGIGNELREKILSLSDQLGYITRKEANEKREFNFAWVSAKRFFLEDEAFYTRIYYYINKRCIEKGYNLSCFVINDKEEIAKQLSPQLLSASFDGIFIAGEFKKEYLDCLYQLDGAKVGIDYYIPGDKTDSIITDNFNIGLEVTNYLIENGHTQIGFVGNIHSTSSICDRYFGYLKALMLSGYSANPDWCITNNDNITGLYTLDFSLPKKMPTAFVCHCDKAAFTLVQRLERDGFAVPEQVSVISFDNTSICELMKPTLTSVRIDHMQIALNSIEQMMYRLHHPEAPPQKRYLSGYLVERNSVFNLK